jgi:hypothetical protein
MNRTLLIWLVVIGVLVLAVAGWTVRGVRWAGRPLALTPRFG